MLNIKEHQSQEIKIWMIASTKPNRNMIEVISYTQVIVQQNAITVTTGVIIGGGTGSDPGRRRSLKIDRWDQIFAKKFE